MNPVPLTFDKMTVKLNENNKKILAKLGQRAKKAHKLLITAYCDRRQVGNAHAAALARGNAVKQELVQLGAKANTIRLKIVTGVADKHAAEIQFS
jgi:outer membrane protein OmpA-like peptidoglycan-associated protein